MSFRKRLVAAATSVSILLGGAALAPTANAHPTVFYSWGLCENYRKYVSGSPESFKCEEQPGGAAELRRTSSSGFTAAGGSSDF